MNNISILLEKYLSLGLKEKNIKQAISKSIEDNCGFTVDNKKIKIQNKTLKVEVFGSEKSEIFINKEKIQKQFKEEIKKLGYDFSDRELL
jgi:hypothetical protein